MIKICARCGFKFVGHDNSLYCDKCREIVRREQLKRNDDSTANVNGGLTRKRSSTRRRARR